VAHVMFAVGWLEKLFGVKYPSRDDSNALSSSTSISIAKERCRLPIYLSQAYLNVSDCVIMTHI